MKAIDFSIDEFWHWFQSHLSDFEALINPDAPFWDVAVSQLKRLNNRLWFELSHPNGGTREFVITAEGHQEAFPIIDAIIASAPVIPGWTFIALKPPMGFDFENNYEGVRFDASTMWFLPLENVSRPQDLGIRVGVPNFAPDTKRQAENAVLVILDTSLGERAAATDIQYVEVSPLPDSPDAHGYLPLPKLPSYISSWRKKNSEA